MRNLNVLKLVIKKNKGKCFLGLFFSLIFCSFVTLMPIISQYLIDIVLMTDEKLQVYYGILIFFIVCSLQPVLYFFKETIFINLCEKISYELRIKAFDKLYKLPLEFYETHKFGEINIKVINDTRELSSYVYILFSSFITSLISIVSLSVAMFIQSWVLSLVIITLILIYAYFSLIFSKKFKILTNKSIKLSEEFQGNVKNTYDNAMLMKIYSCDKSNRIKTQNIIKNIKKSNLKIRKTSNTLNSINMGISAVSLCVIYGLGGLMIIDGKLTLGIVISMGLFFQSLTSPLSSLINGNINYNKVKPSIIRLNDLYSEEEENGNMTFDKENKKIYFKNVNFSYKNSDTLTLNNFNLDINGPGCYGIVGPSGCGKSTIAKLLLGLYPIDSGIVNIFGTDVKEIDKFLLRENVSYVPQDVELSNDTIFNNIKMANSNATFDEVVEICKKLNLHNKIMSLKEDYYSIISEKIDLSGGERRRIAIARGILKPAMIYVFDEAETYLEDEYKDLLLNLYSQLAKDSIVIVITHDSEIYSKIEKVIRL